VGESTLINQLIRNKRFAGYLINNCYSIGIEGSHWFVRRRCGTAAQLQTEAAAV